MRSDTQLAPNSYLHSVLMDGAKPFLYRSSVRSLLGIPDSDGGTLVFSPTLPPVGFTYANSQFMGEPYILPHPIDQSIRSAFHMRGVEPESSEETIPQNIQHDIPPLVGATSVPHSGGFQARDAAARWSATLPESSQHSVTTPASKPERSSVEPSEMLAQPGIISEQTTIHIPGASEGGQYSPALSLSEQGEPLSRKAEERYPYLLSPADTRQGLIEKSLSARKESEPASTPEINAAHVSERLLQAGVARRVAVRPSTGTAETTAIGDMARGDVAIKYASPSTSRTSLSPDARQKSTINPVSGTPNQTDLRTDNRSGRGAADRIEQLRNAVYELVAKTSSRREPTRDEAQPQQQLTPPPVQQVVLVRRPPNQARILHAFWERSYLGRARARILR